MVSQITWRRESTVCPFWACAYEWVNGCIAPNSVYISLTLCSRHCGRLLCAKCTHQQMPIIKYDLHKPVRLCDVCHDVLSLHWSSLALAKLLFKATRFMESICSNRSLAFVSLSPFCTLLGACQELLLRYGSVGVALTLALSGCFVPISTRIVFVILFICGSGIVIISPWWLWEFQCTPLAGGCFFSLFFYCFVLSLPLSLSHIHTHNSVACNLLLEVSHNRCVGTNREL